MILESVEHGPLIWPTIEENGVTRTKKYAELSAAKKIQADCDMKATNIILQDPLALVANHQMTPPHFNTYQSSYNNPQLQQQFPPSQYGSIHPTQHYSSTYPSQPQFNHSSVPPSYPYQSQMKYQTSSVPQIAYQSPQVSTQPMTESPLVDSGLAVHVFSLRDDPIACLNKAMAFLTVVASSRFPSTNNQLRTSTNPRNQATIQDGRVIVQQVQGRQGQSYSSERHMARQCTQPKRPRNASWYKDKAMLAKAQEAGQILDEEQLAFLADPGVLDGQVVQTIIPNNANFQTEDLDTYDSDCDDVSNAKAVLMANISNYGSDVITEVPHSETYLNDMENQSVHAMQDFEQTQVVDVTDNEITSDSNIISYSQYLQATQQANVQDTNLQAQQDSMILSVIEQMSEQMINHVNNWEKANKEQNNESVTVELEKYKERVKTFEQCLNIDLSSREKMIGSQMDDMIKEKLALKEQVDSLEQNLSKQIKEKESLLQTFTVFKNESKEKENKYIENEIELEKKIKELDNSYQNPFYLKKAQRIKPTLYDGIVISNKHVAMHVIDDEETLILEEESRSKMSEKEKDSEAIKQNISHKPIDYVKLNRLSEDFGKRFVPQQELSAEQAFWYHMSNPSTKSSDASPVKMEAPKELPKVSLVNESLKKLKFHLAKFDNVVKIILDARTEGEWGFEHTKAVFNNEIIPFLKSLKDIFNVFDKDLLNEIMEVQTVFDQMEAVVQQSSVDKQCLEIAKKELLLENDLDSYNKTFFENNDLKAQLQDKDTTICKLKEIIKSMREKSKEENVNYDYCEIETKNVELENSVAKLLSENERLCKEINHVKQVFKDQFDSIKKTRVRTKEQSDSLIDKLNLKSAENEDLKAQIQDKVFVITSLKNDLRKLKGKEIVDIAAQIPSANTIVPGMFKLDLEPLAPRLLQNKEAHIDYLKYTQEQADILREIVEQAKAKQPLDDELDLACKHAQRIQELLVYVRDTCPNAIKLSAKKVVVTPKNNVKKVRFAEPLTSSSNIKQLKANSELICATCKKSMFDGVHDMCHVFTEVGLKWKPTGRTFTIVGNSFPLTRITSANAVPPKKITSLSVETQKPKLKVCSRKPKNVKNVGSSKKAKIVESKNANHSEPNHTWGSNATDIPSSSSLVMTVRFGNDHIARIMGYGDYQLGNVTISRVYYVEGLGHNLFSVGQFCDADLEVSFRKNTCFIRNLEGVDLLSGSRDTNLYTISLDDMLKTSPICLLSKASKTKSWLWHRQLSHLNFGTLNKLAKDGLARGIPRLKFQKDHLCLAYALGKSKKSSHQPKAEDTNQEKLYLLHMDLCGPIFLRTKDEAPKAIIKCIKNIQVRLNATVHNVRTDNGSEFVNQTLREFYENVGISHQSLLPVLLSRTTLSKGKTELL
ncbi:retrovirus-related pol polyprotein from transposon TNT 1-94 [Tanacetum coccineum]|uniref:Retrovirus-related pol polyprotein from transposon TNT 1-94 n=1 Tax=Tanacetum coccineum TaxID=301880 RepID=A0ABQ5EVE2_9ASTR